MTRPQSGLQVYPNDPRGQSILLDYMGRLINANVPTTQASFTPGIVVTVPISIPNAATTTYAFTVLDNIELIDCRCIKLTAAGAGNTMQIAQQGLGNITDAIACATQDNITRMGVRTSANAVFALNATLQVIATRSAGDSSALVLIDFLIRS